MNGIVHVEAELTNPPDKWILDQKVDFPAGAEKGIVMQVLNGIRAVGLIKQLDDNKVEVIPEGRVVRYVAELKTVMIADNLDLAKATSGGKLVTP